MRQIAEIGGVFGNMQALNPFFWGKAMGLLLSKM